MRTFAATLLALGFTLAAPASADAADFSAALCAGTRELQIELDAKGNGVFDVHGLIGDCATCTPGKNVVVAGTGVLEAPNTIRIGLTLLSTDLDSVPVIWEFVVDLTTLQGVGNFEWLTGGELFGELFLGPGPCPEKATALPPEAFGATQR